MTVTTLDPNAALIVIDLQKGIVSLPTVHPIGDVVKHHVNEIETEHRALRDYIATA